MNHYDIITKLIGPIQPAGASHIDPERLENLKAMTELVDALLTDIDAVAMMKDRPEHSVSKAGKFASEFFNQIGIEE